MTLQTNRWTTKVSSTFAQFHTVDRSRASGRTATFLSASSRLLLQPHTPHGVRVPEHDDTAAYTCCTVDVLSLLYYRAVLKPQIKAKCRLAVSIVDYSAKPLKLRLMVQKPCAEKEMTLSKKAANESPELSKLCDLIQTSLSPS